MRTYLPYQNAGAEWMLHTMLRALADRGCTVQVLLERVRPGMTAGHEMHGVAILPRRGEDDFLDIFRDPVRRPDVIVTQQPATGPATSLGERFGVPVVQIVHSASPDSITCCDRAALVVVNAEWIGDAIGLRDPLVIHPPVPAADYATIPGECVTLINLKLTKGAQVFYQLAERFPDQRFLGVRGGYGAQVIRADLPNVEIIDTVPGDRMRDAVYARSRILLVPSLYESYGRVGVEAMCSGIPVIANPTPGLRESLGDAGVFRDIDDLDSWAEALAGLLAPEGWHEASRRAVRRARDLDPAADLERWCAAIRSLAER
ncbi:glycosyltransferase [Actinomadura vinacea]|uniref:Glycosyltransferase n=1 Tax=Actinomadura vinacea TaxID=115336 RepID=A0ABN3IJR5_9ACTN